MHADEAHFHDALIREGRDLTAAAMAGELPPVAFREAVAAHVHALLKRRRSVLLVGPSGAGRTSVVHALAALVARTRSEHEWLQAVVEWPASHFLTGTRFLGEWQTKTAAVIESADAEGIALFVLDVWHLVEAGRVSGGQSNVLAQLRPALQQGRIVLVGEVTPEQLASLEATAGVRGLFEHVLVAPLSPAEAARVVESRAASANLALDAATHGVLRDLCARFLARAHPPGPELHLLAQVIAARDARERAGEAPPTIDGDFIESVFSERSGLPAFVVSQSAICSVDAVRTFFTQRIVGQRAAIDAVVEAIALFKAGLCDPGRPIGSFLFVGPTGVGKTELARALAEFLFGSDGRLLRFDLTEFKDYQAFEQLVGSPRAPEQRARLLEPVAAQPFQVVLFDELEKAHANLWDLLLPLLDEGYLTTTGGERVDFRSTLIICTSNVGSGAPERSVGFGPPLNDRQATAGAMVAHAARVREALDTAFRPELLNRFQNIVVFHPLSVDDVRTIARKELQTLFARDGLVRRRLTVEVDNSALDLAANVGFDARYGARALKRELQHQLVLPLAKTLMERPLPPGSVLHLYAREGRVEVRVDDTTESRALRRETTPVPLGDGRRLTREDASTWLRRLVSGLAGLSERADVTSLAMRLAALDGEHDVLSPWQDTAHALQLTVERQALRAVLGRFSSLQADASRLELALRPPLSRDALARHGRELERLEHHLRSLWRELCVFGTEGLQDALIHITPISSAHGALSVDFVAQLYARWSVGRGGTVEWLCEPNAADEPALLGILGYAPYGLLRGEAGLHRVRRDVDTVGAVAVRVLPWRGAAPALDLPRATERCTLKLTGRHGGALRTRLAIPGAPLLQNGRTLAENDTLAREVLTAWRHGAEALAAAEPAPVVRRYGLEPPHWRDTLLEESTSRTDCCGPDALHALLCRRADRLAGARPLLDDEPD